MSDLRDHHTFIIVDLECTCWENDPRMVMETIEIGAVVYAVGQGSSRNSSVSCVRS